MIGSLVARLHRDDHGAMALMVALLIVFVVLPVAAVSVDLSNAYANRRQMQNAADAAAQAGAQVMAMGGPAASIDAAAKSVATANGVQTTDPAYSCEVATIAYSGGSASVTNAAPCASWSSTGGFNAVRVHTVRTIQAFFAPALGLLDGSSGRSSTRAATAATAAIQKISNPDLGNAQFAMCAYDDGHHPDPSWKLLLNQVSPGVYDLNLDAVGQYYVMWSNGGGNSNLSGCGLNPSFTGRICGLATPYCGLPITLPNTLAVNTGAAVGPTLAAMAGYPQCDPNNFTGGTQVSFTPCAMDVPVCHGSNGLTGNNARLYCDAFGEFVVSPGAQNAVGSSCTFIVGTSDTICARFEGRVRPATGSLDCPPAPAPCTPGANDPYRVALVQ